MAGPLLYVIMGATGSGPLAIAGGVIAGRWLGSRGQAMEIMKAYGDGVNDGEANAKKQQELTRANKYHADNHGREGHICTDYYCGEKKGG